MHLPSFVYLFVLNENKVKTSKLPKASAGELAHRCLDPYFHLVWGLVSKCLWHLSGAQRHRSVPEVRCCSHKSSHLSVPREGQG